MISVTTACTTMTTMMSVLGSLASEIWKGSRFRELLISA